MNAVDILEDGIPKDYVNKLLHSSAGEGIVAVWLMFHNMMC